MSEGFNVKSLIVPGLIAGGLFLLFREGDAKAAEPTPTPPTPPTPPGPTPPGPVVKLPTVVPITNDLNTPGKFAAKFTGDWTRWKEIAAANPGMIVVDKKREVSDGAGGTTVYYDAGVFPNGKTVMLNQPGLVPWNLGQPVVLPDSWVK